MPECGKEFSFDGGEAQVFEVPWVSAIYSQISK